MAPPNPPDPPEPVAAPPPGVGGPPRVDGADTAHDDRRIPVKRAIATGLVLCGLLALWLLGVFLVLLSVTPEQAPRIWTAMSLSAVVWLLAAVGFVVGLLKRRPWLFVVVLGALVASMGWMFAEMVAGP